MFQGYSVTLTKKMDGFRTGAQREADMTFGKSENPRMEKSQQLPKATDVCVWGVRPQGATGENVLRAKGIVLCPD